MWRWWFFAVARILVPLDLTLKFEDEPVLALDLIGEFQDGFMQFPEIVFEERVPGFQLHNSLGEFVIRHVAKNDLAGWVMQVGR